MGFKEDLHKYLIDSRTKKYKFAKRLGISNTTLHRYCEGETDIPKSMKIAIIHITEGKLKFEGIDNG